MKAAFVSLICYDSIYKENLIAHRNNPDYLDTEILANSLDPVHKWCRMLKINGVDIEFWYLSHLSRTPNVFKHKYGHRLRRIPGFKLGKYFSKYFDCNMSFELLKELKRQNITHVLGLGCLMNERLPIDMFDILVIFCRKNNIKIFPIYGGGSINSYRLPKRKLKSMFLKKTDGFFCQSSSELNIMVNSHSFPKTKMHYFKNPLDLENFYPAPKDICGKFLNFDVSNKYLLYVGRFVQYKGIHHLINIFPRLIIKEPRLKLLIIGWGPYEENLRRLARQADNNDAIKFIGFVENDKLKYYYGLSDIVVLPSYVEGVPNVLMEALACNIACLATDVGGIPDLLSDGAGIMIPPKNEEALYGAIINILQKGFKVNQEKRKKILEEIDLVKKGKELKQILLTSKGR